MIHRGESPAGPPRVGLGPAHRLQPHVGLQEPCRHDGHRDGSTGSSSSLPALSPPRRTRRLLLGCFHSQLEGSAAQKPTQQHGPAAKPCSISSGRARCSTGTHRPTPPRLHVVALCSFHFRHHLLTTRASRLPNSFISSRSSSRAQTPHRANNPSDACRIHTELMEDGFLSGSFASPR